MVINLNKLEKDMLFEDFGPEFPPPDIIAYNELRSCSDLYRMYYQGILEIQPEFEREVVWNVSDQTRFLDSLMKQLPIPSMCFSLDYKTQKWQVIDGLQRMWTIKRFLSGEPWTLAKLDDIDIKISGQSTKKFHDRNSPLYKYYTRVENLTLPITVLRCDYSKTDHMKYLFTIFHRLNTGGLKLNNQEIRNCISGGSFNNLLKDLDNNPSWRMINRMKKGSSHRFTKQELILRFFAFHDRYHEYPGGLARFLNVYMNTNREPGDQFLNEKRELFNRTVDVLYRKLFEGKPPKLSVTVLEALLVGISLNLHFVESLPNNQIQFMYKLLTNHEEFTDEKLREGLAQKTRVINRMSASQAIFSGQ